MAKIYQKYEIRKTDGTPVDPSAQYFVLRIDTDKHARRALLAYAKSVEAEDPEFARLLRMAIVAVVTGTKTTQ